MATRDELRRFRDKVRTINADQYLTRLKKAGWFEGQSERAIQAIARRVRRAFASNPGEAFYALADVRFEVDCIEEEGSYEGALMQLSEVSRGRFRPDDLRDDVDFDEGVARISFELDGDSFEREFEQTRGWFSDEALELANEALEATDCDERFIALPRNDVTVDICFVQQEIFDRAVDMGLIPDADVFSLDDETSVDD